MKNERYKELMTQVGMPESQSLLYALKQCSMESALEERDRNIRVIDSMQLDLCDSSCIEQVKSFLKKKLIWGNVEG